MLPLIRQLLRATYYLSSALIGVLSLVPVAALPTVSMSDKAEHVIAYAFLGLTGGASSERGISRTFLGLAGFGLALELLQTFSPGRSPDALDVVADIIGAVLGCGAAIALRTMTPMLVDRSADRKTSCRASNAGGDACAGER